MLNFVMRGFNLSLIIVAFLSSPRWSRTTVSSSSDCRINRYTSGPFCQSDTRESNSEPSRPKRDVLPNAPVSELFCKPRTQRVFPRFAFSFTVGVTGFEPAILSSPSLRPTKLDHTPFVSIRGWSRTNDVSFYAVHHGSSVSLGTSTFSVESS